MNCGLLRLRCRVQHYSWGDTEFIPALLGIDNPDREPYAELWMGARPDLPAEAEVEGKWFPLDELIESSPEAILGPEVTREFEGRLPYLFKVLSAKAPLSIQAHPSKDAARQGFERKNAAAIPLTARRRNHRDANHKPELITALTDFYGLRGFRSLPDIARVLQRAPEFRGLVSGFEPTSAFLKALYEEFMRLPQAEVDSILDPLVQRLKQADAKRPFTRHEPEYWVLRADRHHFTDGHRDRGLLSIYLLNLVHLQPGEAMYLPAGILHAYLEGSGMEIMANSNNVLRGGLTPKRVDVPELLATLTFEGGSAEILRAVPIPDSREWKYEAPASEFELRRLEIDAGQRHENGADHSAEIVILMASEDDARVSVESGGRSLELRSGDACLAPFGIAYTVSAAGPATLYKATVPVTGPYDSGERGSEALFRSHLRDGTCVLGLARSADGIHDWRVDPEPAMLPCREGDLFADGLDPAPADPPRLAQHLPRRARHDGWQPMPNGSRPDTEIEIVPPRVNSRPGAAAQALEYGAYEDRGAGPRERSTRRGALSLLEEQKSMKDVVLRSSANPLITVVDLPYQANAVFNAGAADLGEDVLLLLRVESCSGRSHLIVARSEDGVSEWRVEETALLHPAQGYSYESNGVEDCRITWMEDLDAWGIAYTAYSPYGPGVAIATTRDFRTVERIGMVLPPEDKNAALFPCKFDGLHAMFHRPSVGGGTAWISYSPDLVFWGKAKMVIPVRGGPWWDANRVGVGLPPIRTEAGWLVIYHGVKEVAGGPIYRLGAALLDLAEPHRLVGRTRRWLMSPQAGYERMGDAPNVIFASGGFVRDDTLWIYYGAADSCICLATVGVTEILRFIEDEGIS